MYSLHLSLRDRLGVLSDILDVIAKGNVNILTVVQNMPLDGEAYATILLIQVSEDMLKSIESLVERLREYCGWC